MGIKLSDLEERSRLTIVASTDMGEMKLQAFLKKVLKPNVAIIDVVFHEGRMLNFDNVQLNIEYAPEDEVPFIWRAARIVNVKNQYVLQVNGDGVRHNRRSCFRIMVGCYARMAMLGRQNVDVLVRDVSLSGFSIADRDRNLNLELGNELTVLFNDFGYELKLIGRVVRVEELENMIIYGLETRNLCKDLSTYISVKQQRNRRKKER